MEKKQFETLIVGIANHPMPLSTMRRLTGIKNKEKLKKFLDGYEVCYEDDLPEK